MSRRSSILLVGTVVLAAGLLACGKKGPPLPPHPPVFPEIVETTFLQRGEDLLVTWGMRTPPGEGKRALAQRFRILTAPAGEGVAAGAEAQESVLRGLLEPAAEREPFELSFGPRYRWRWEEVLENPVPRLLSVEILTSFKKRAVRGPLFRFRPSTPPSPPSDLVAEPVREGIRLRWSPPGEGLPVRLYRVPTETDVAPRPLALVEEDVGYLDEEAELDQGYHYFAAVVSRPEEGAGLERLGAVEAGRQKAAWEAVEMELESELVGPTTATFVDLYPPPVPEGPRAFPEADAVVLLWNPVEAPDLAGYHVYRSAPGGEPQRLTDEPEEDTVYRDSAVGPGDTWVYRISAVDRREPPNESELSAPAEAEMPRRDGTP